MKGLQAAGIALALSIVTIAAAAEAAENAPFTPTAPRRTTAIFRFSKPAEARAVCRPSERACQIGDYIVWCCRADQQCDYAYPGGCR